MAFVVLHWLLLFGLANFAGTHIMLISDGKSTLDFIKWGVSLAGVTGKQLSPVIRLPALVMRFTEHEFDADWHQRSCPQRH